ICSLSFPSCSEDSMRNAGVAHNKSSKEMENHVFLKAKSREEYLSLVARLIIHFRDIREYSHACLRRALLAIRILEGGTVGAGKSEIKNKH
uniref:Mediator of RNA polymerase II transcription subunit 15 n=1 Tax=Podarcis muralis TaxID=64176 RepID=A0A670JVS3_PODMU